MTRLLNHLRLLPIVFLFFITKTNSQSNSFFHLTVADGLSDNYVRSLAVDKQGFLWIGTTEGLNVFDGHQVTSYVTSLQPQMASNHIIHLTCDRRDRIWQGTSEGISWLDERRRFHRVILQDSITRFASRTILDTKRFGPVLFTGLGQFYFDEKEKKWRKLDWIPPQLAYNKFSDAEPLGDDKIIYATTSEIIVLDYDQQKIVYEQPFSKVVSVCHYSDHEIAIGFQPGYVKIVDINTNNVLKEYELNTEVNKKQVTASINEVRLASNGSILISSDNDGLFVIDRNGNIAHYKHNPIDPGSIGSNIARRVIGSDDGDVIIGSTISGISSFNINNSMAGHNSIFSDGKGDFYDNYIADITEDKKGYLWMGGSDRLIRWDKNSNLSKFYYYNSNASGHSLELRSVCTDSLGRIWVGSLGDGLAILDEATGQFKKIKPDTAKGPAVKSNIILDLLTSSSGLIWVATPSGMYTIDPSDLNVNAFTDHPLLKEISGKRVNALMQDSKGRIWIATLLAGTYCFDKSANKLLHYTKENGLPSNQCWSICEDKNKNIYIAHNAGFTIISPGGKLNSFSLKNGLRYDRCDGITMDNNGKIWASNIKCLITFDPATESIQVFDQNTGLTAEGFRGGSHLKARSGELFWGSRRGVNYFFPGQLRKDNLKLKVNIYQADIADSIIHTVAGDKIRLRFARNTIVFHFTAVTLQELVPIRFRFMLDGYDKEWQEGIDIREARYSLLPAGNYHFKVEGSVDGINWVAANNSNLLVKIIPPLWQQWWFIGLCALVLAISGVMMIQNRNKKITKQKEELETEQAINYFSSSISEQQTESDILWDVAKNCIGRLQFEDCAIYMMDEKRNLLIQKAAHGPKRPNQTTAEQEFEIKPGEGIVGNSALCGKAEIVNDTTKDKRYILGIGQGQSEISVPIMYNDKVLGVIDCEHSKKRFFTQKHLSILTTIASLCANKIVRARAEEEKKKAETVLMDTKRKMTEVEMQALRAQMNPHFIFNCLNSINRYIVKSDQTTASLYLTKFAKLMRLILDNSNSKNVILTNELDALKLYIEMEALRFDKQFSYEVKVEPHLSTDCIEVPPLIIQPYVENAIWHGLLHKEKNGHLSINVSMTDNSLLQCVIEDNGIGRAKAKELRSKTVTSRKSLGMQLTESRLSLLNNHAQLNASVEIIDMKNGNDEALGTKVILKIPV